MLQVSDILCPVKTKDFEEVSLSRKTITFRIEECLSHNSVKDTTDGAPNMTGAKSGF